MPNVDIRCTTHHICACLDAELSRHRARSPLLEDVATAAREYVGAGTASSRQRLKDALTLLDGGEVNVKPIGDYRQARGAIPWDGAATSEIQPSTIEDAMYALVDGNLVGEDIPVGDVKDWLESIKATRDAECRWVYIDDENDYWETACGDAFCFIDGSPTENEMHYCPYCGRKLKEVIPEGAPNMEEENGE